MHQAFKILLWFFAIVGFLTVACLAVAAAVGYYSYRKATSYTCTHYLAEIHDTSALNSPKLGSVVSLGAYIEMRKKQTGHYEKEPETPEQLTAYARELSAICNAQPDTKLMDFLILQTTETDKNRIQAFDELNKILATTKLVPDPAAEKFALTLRKEELYHKASEAVASSTVPAWMTLSPTQPPVK